MGKWHPESPHRLDAINDRLLSSGLMDFLVQKQARPASDTDLLRVHAPEYLDWLRKNAPTEGYFPIDPDTVMNPHTLDAALAAAGAGITAVDAIMRDGYKHAFCAVRPPGHHARRAQAMGFCFFNNLAVAVAYAMEQYGLERVGIVDFDVHHGNGTEETFANDDRVLMCSFFQHPFFPGVRLDPAPSNMINIPVDPYTKGDALRQIVSDIWMPALVRHDPQFFFISAGFDGHREDEMGQLALVESDYAWITSQIVDLADKTANGRVVSFLEGGYDLSALGRSAEAHVRALAPL
jgi:acetoin utilization deacetylase AcuC-like enzyme